MKMYIVCYYHIVLSHSMYTPTKAATFTRVNELDSVPCRAACVPSNDGTLQAVMKPSLNYLQCEFTYFDAIKVSTWERCESI